MASALARQRGPRGSLPAPARHAVTPAPSPWHRAAPRRARPPAARSPLPPPRAPAGQGVVRRWEETQAGGNRRRDARGSLAASSWGQKPRLPGGGHVIPFKDGRPVVLMNNTWWGEGVRVGWRGRRIYSFSQSIASPVLLLPPARAPAWRRGVAGLLWEGRGFSPSLLGSAWAALGSRYLGASTLQSNSSRRG